MYVMLFFSAVIDYTTGFPVCAYNFKTFLELNFKNTSSKDQILVNQIILLLNN